MERRWFIDDEGFVPAQVSTEDNRQEQIQATREFRYGRMFKLPALPSGNEALKALGAAIQNNIPDNEEVSVSGMDVNSPATIGTSRIPAGYVYLGQFINHDITFDQTAGIPDSDLTFEQIKRGRTPSLDLESLYGMGPLSKSSRHLYEDDCIRFKIGKTTPTVLGNATTEFDNDLPRYDLNSGKPREALIADRRNDRNLALAQVHLAFLKFHNAVVDHLEKDGLTGPELFYAARKMVIQHYQYIVLHDFLRNVLDHNVLDNVLDEKPKYFEQRDESSLPVEFAFAAFRFGHSMVSEKYQWNSLFKIEGDKPEDDKSARLHQLFIFSGLGGNMKRAPTLPSNWVIDWTRFFNFGSIEEFVNNPKTNKARKIGPSVSSRMNSLPGFPKSPKVESGSLAILDLMMGPLLGLPTGQAIANKIGAESLKADEIANGNDVETKTLIDYKFHEHTPLWYYILKEAEVKNKGEYLGEVGSRIVAETIYRLIEASEFSILKEDGWKPSLGRRQPEFGMVDLFEFVNDYKPTGRQTNELNPLENTIPPTEHVLKRI